MVCCLTSLLAFVLEEQYSQHKSILFVIFFRVVECRDYETMISKRIVDIKILRKSESSRE